MINYIPDVNFNCTATRHENFLQITEELQQVFPDLVSVNVHPGKTKNDPSIEYLGVNYIGLIPVLTAGIKEQQNIIEQQQQTIDAQQQLLQELLNRVEALENRD